MVTKKAAGKAKVKPVAGKQPPKNKKQTSTRRREPKEKTLAEIFKEQGVKPFDSSQDGKNWPKGADFQEFLDAIHSGRK